MKFFLIFLLLYFIEIIAELGLGVNTKIIEGFSLKNLMLYGALAALLGFKLSGIKKNILIHPSTVVFDRFMFGYLVLALLSVFYGSVIDNPSYGPLNGLMLVKNRLFDPMLTYIAFAFFFAASKTPDTGLKILLVAFSVLSALAIVEVVLGLNLYGLDENNLRPNGLLGEPNQSAAVIAFAIPLLASFCIAKDKFFILYLGCLFGLFAAVLVSGSRGGMLAAGVGMSYWLFMLRGRLNIGVLLLALIMLPLLVMGSFLILPEYYQELLLERLGFLSESNIDVESASAGRTTIWERAMHLVYKQPILGWGYAGYNMMMGAAPHNTYLDVLFSFGFVGLAYYLVFIFMLFRVFKYTKLEFVNNNYVFLVGVKAGLLGIFAALFFLDLYMPSIIFWALVGAATACVNHRYKQHMIIRSRKLRESSR